MLLLLRGVLLRPPHTHTHPQRFLLLLCRHPFGCQINLHSNCSSRPSRLSKLRRRRGVGGGRRLEMCLGTRHVMAHTVGVACATTSCIAARGASSSVILTRCRRKNPDRRCRYHVFLSYVFFQTLSSFSQFSPCSAKHAASTCHTYLACSLYECVVHPKPPNWITLYINFFPPSAM